MSKGPILLLAAILLALAMGGAALAGVQSALAQAPPNYNLGWHVIGGGGRPASSAHYVVHSTAGQGATSPPYSASTSYVVSGGYWYKGAGSGQKVYLPLVFKAFP